MYVKCVPLTGTSLEKQNISMTIITGCSKILESWEKEEFPRKQMIDPSMAKIIFINTTRDFQKKQFKNFTNCTARTLNYSVMKFQKVFSEETKTSECLFSPDI